MLSLVRGDGAVICVFFSSTRVSDDRFGDTFDVIEWLLHAPETTSREDGCFGFGLSRDRAGAKQGGKNNEKFRHGPS